jgi:hypothetical protein
MRSLQWLRNTGVVAGVLATGAVACGDGTSAGVAPSQARISIESDMIASRTAALDWFASVAGAAAAISPDTVLSLEVTFTEVAFLPVGEDEEGAGGWQTITLDAPVTLDLMALPTEEEGSVVIAAGSLAVGTYQKVRLMVGDGEIVFKGPLTLGTAITYEGGEPYAVTVPSGDQTGLKTDLSFEVTAGENAEANAAYIVFAAGATFQNVSATGVGGVTLAPVLRAPGAE